MQKSNSALPILLTASRTRPNANCRMKKDDFQHSSEGSTGRVDLFGFIFVLFRCGYLVAPIVMDILLNITEKQFKIINVQHLSNSSHKEVQNENHNS